MAPNLSLRVILSVSRCGAVRCGAVRQQAVAECKDTDQARARKTVSNKYVLVCLLQPCSSDKSCGRAGI